MRYCTLSFLAVVCVGTLARGAEGGPKSAADVFGPAKLHAMTLTLTEQAWEDMQPLQGIRPNAPRDRRPPTAGPDGKPAPTPAQAAAAKPRETVVSQFGYEFPFAKGTIEFHGTVYKDVGLRFKGNSAYMTASDGLKRPIKLDFDRHVPGQKFFGMSSLNLCNNSFDPSQMREVLSYHVYEAAGVPSPRTAYAEVFLTVPNRFDKEYVGLYTLIEQIDKSFLKDRFKTTHGLLLKPERLTGLPHFGDDWAAYVERYQPKSAGSNATTRQFMAFTKFLRDADDATFAREIGTYVEMDEFLRYLAASVVMSNMDSFLSLGHNYYMHVHPDTKKISWLPWDLNLSFGGLMLMNFDQQMEMSIRKPYAMPNRLIDRVLAVKEYDSIYRGHLKALVDGPFKPATIKAEIAAIQKVIQPSLDRDAKLIGQREPPVQPMWVSMTKGMPTLEVFIDRRVASITQQLAGTSEGKEVKFGMMFAPPPKPKDGAKPAPNPFGAGAMMSTAIMKAADADKDGKLTMEEVLFAAGRLFQEMDQNKDSVVDAREMVEGLNRLMAQPGFGMLGAAPKWDQPARLKTKRKAPPGMGPGFFLGDPIIKVIDANHDDKITLGEWLAAVKKHFAMWDKDNKGSLDQKALSAGLDALFPPTPGEEPAPPAAKPPAAKPPAK